MTQKLDPNGPKRSPNELPKATEGENRKTKTNGEITQKGKREERREKIEERSEQRRERREEGEEGTNEEREERGDEREK